MPDNADKDIFKPRSERKQIEFAVPSMLSDDLSSSVNIGIRIEFGVKNRLSCNFKVSIEECFGLHLRPMLEHLAGPPLQRPSHVGSSRIGL